MAKKSSRPFSNLDPARVLDIAVRVSLGLFFAFAAGIYCRNALLLWETMDTTHLTSQFFSKGLSIFVTGLYTLMIACLYVVRTRAKNKFVGIWPSIAALLGGFLMFGLILFKPRGDLPVQAQIAASFLVVVGNIFAIYILAYLGRSFSILPESRKLVMEGPYRFIRHPLYVAETVASVGVMIAFLSPGAIVIVVAQFLFQLVRIHYEEKVLTKSFPEYKNYAKHTQRFIPGIY